MIIFELQIYHFLSKFVPKNQYAEYVYYMDFPFLESVRFRTVSVRFRYTFWVFLWLIESGSS